MGRHLCLVAGLVTAFSATAVLAGRGPESNAALSITRQVYNGRNWVYATGALAVIRADSNPNTKFECWVDATDTSRVYAGCYAARNSNDSAYCTTSQPHLIHIIESIGPASTVGFTGLTGTCIGVTVTNSSTNL